ncbi:MAG: DUF84 family protein [Patescibacteria group bacterium]|nr:DUF84 family protein [Patescibacteria group bacterium]
MKFALGTSSKHKMEALVQACSMMGWDNVDIIEKHVDSAIAKQPVDFQWILAGARNRVLFTAESCPDVPCIGIENGIVRAWNVHLDVACIAVLLPDGSWHYSSTPGIEIPEDVVKQAQERGFDNTTIGDILAEIHGCDNCDPHVLLTNGRLRRADLLAQGLYAVFTQIKW